MNFDNLPEELRTGKYFIFWKKEEIKGEIKKVPKRPSDGKNIPDVWTYREEDCAGIEITQNYNGYDGVGYLCHPRNGLIALDLDGCLDEKGKLSWWAEELVNKLNSYTEVTPTGNGIRIWIKGEIDKNIWQAHAAKKREFAIPKRPGVEYTKSPKIEVFWEYGFLTLTGEIYGEKREIKEVNASELRDWISDTQFIEELNRDVDEAKTSERQDHKLFVAALEGDIKPFSNDESTADFVLVKEIARRLLKKRKTDDERKSQAYRVIRRLPLGKREKWDREDYLPRTWEKAINSISANINPTIKERDSREWDCEWASSFGDPQELPYLVKDLIAEKTNIMLASAPKVGKSNLVADLALAIASGQEFLGRKTKKGVVVYVDAEGIKTDTMNRFIGAAQIRKCPEALRNIFVFFCAPRISVIPTGTNRDEEFDTTRLVEHVKFQLGEQGHSFDSVRLVILDTLHATVIGKVNEQAEISNYMRALTLIREELNCSTLFCHHTTRDDDTRYSGSVNIEGNVSTHLVLARRKIEKDEESKTEEGFGVSKVEMIVKAQRAYQSTDSFFFELRGTPLLKQDGSRALTSEGEAITIASVRPLDSKKQQLIIKTHKSEQKNNILTFLSAHRDACFASKDIGEKLSISGGSIRRVLDELVEAREVIKITKQDRSVVYSIGNPSPREVPSEPTEKKEPIIDNKELAKGLGISEEKLNKRLRIAEEMLKKQEEAVSGQDK